LKGNLLHSLDIQPASAVVVIISTKIIGGPGKGLLQLIPGLNSGNCAKPIVCIFKKRGEGDSLFVSACKQRGINVIPLLQRFNFDPQPFLQLIRLIREQKMDIIQTHGYKESFFGFILKWITRKRWICFLHGTTEENLKVRLYHTLDKFLARFSDRIVSVSQELAERIVPRRYFYKVRIVENAVEPNKSKVNPLIVAEWKRRFGIEKSNIIVCVGRLSPEKGQDVLLDAARGLVNSGLNFQIVLAGNGPSRRNLERKCFQLNLRDHIKFLGQRKDMDMVYAASDILALPSFKEGMPNVILEAMAHGLPIVATRVGSIPEILKNGVDAILVPSGNAAALQTALEDLLRNPEKARFYGEAAAKVLFPRFSVAYRVEKMENIYRELAQDA
jgi:glycosyltransferase involved in cell wall biosynthesis